MLNNMDLEMSAIEADPFGFVAKLSQQLAGACELLLVHDAAIRNLIAENHQLRERIAVLEAAGRVNRRDEEQPVEQPPLPQLH